MTEVPDDTRRTLPELRVLYELFDELRDVYVEGRHDRLAIEAFLRWAGATFNVQVYEVNDRVDISAGDLFQLGLEDGHRSRVIALALAAADWPTPQCVTGLVDADAAHSGSSLPTLSTLLVTDGTSFETYALSAATLDKFLALTLRKDGSGGELLAAISPPLTEMFIARRVLHEAATGASLPDSCLRKAAVNGNSVEVSAEALLERAQPALTKAQLSSLRPKCEELRIGLPEDIRQRARGHDIAIVIGRALNLPAAWGKADVIEGGLLGNLDFRLLSEEGMFKDLLSRVA